MTSAHLRMYKSRLHVAFTITVLVVPFILLIALFLLSGRDISGFFLNASISVVRLTVAYLISVVLAWLGAILFYRGKMADIGLPIFDVLQSFPAFAALPLAVQIWGPTNTVVILFLTIAVIWPIFFSIIGSLKLVKRDWEEAATMANLSYPQYVRYFLLPISLPGIITGSVIGLGEGWEALIATEIIAKVKQGAGAYFTTFANQPIDITFGIVGFLVIIFVLNKIIWLPLLAASHARLEE